MAGSQEAFVTLATNDTYAVGALVLANSLRNVGTSRQIAILITQGVTQGMREILSGTFDLVWVVDLLDSQDRTNLQLLARQDLGVTFTKLHCWRLTQYTKCVFMDADTLVMQNIDDLFEREEFSAAPDPGWPDCFNSGVFVFRPSDETFQNLMEFAMTHGTFDGGDQGLLNLFFSDWATKDISRHLPFVYNCVSMAFYSYLPAFKQFGKNVKVAHFIGASKPWHYAFNPSTGQVEDVDASGGHAQEFLQMWWRIFVERVKASLEGGMMMPFHIVPSKAFCSDPPTEVAPYCPPDIPVYYAPTIPSANHDPVHIEYRDCYNYLETFYVEPPMANIELYPNPGHQAYGTKEFESLCKEYFSTPSEEQSVSDAEKKTPYSNADVSVHHQPSEEPVRCPNEEQIVDHVPPEESVQCDQHDLEPVHQCCEESIFPNDEEKQINVSQEPALSQPIEVNHTVNTPQNVLTSKNEQQSESQQGAQTSSERELHQYQNGSIESDMGLSEELGSLRIATPPAGHQGSVAVVLDDPDRQFRWEQGQIDYLGVDSFENIKAKLDQSIKEKDTEKVPTKASVKAGKTPDRSSPQNKSKGPKEPSPAK